MEPPDKYIKPKLNFKELIQIRQMQVPPTPLGFLSLHMPSRKALPSPVHHGGTSEASRRYQDYQNSLDILAQIRSTQTTTLQSNKISKKQYKEQNQQLNQSHHIVSMDSIQIGIFQWRRQRTPAHLFKFFSQLLHMLFSKPLLQSLSISIVPEIKTIILRSIISSSAPKPPTPPSPTHCNPPSSSPPPASSPPAGPSSRQNLHRLPHRLLAVQCRLARSRLRQPPPAPRCPDGCSRPDMPVLLARPGIRLHRPGRLSPA